MEESPQRGGGGTENKKRVQKPPVRKNLDDEIWKIKKPRREMAVGGKKEFGQIGGRKEKKEFNNASS